MKQPTRRPHRLRQTPVAAIIAASFTTLLAGQALAQAAAAPADAASAANKAKSPDSLETMVVTVTASPHTRLQSSVSVTEVGDEQVQALSPQTQSEILRLIPGIIDNGGNGPGGNANISVRGLPITTGGSPFVQLQEDGLPTVLFGDMNFGNNDYWIRFNRSNTIESVRGGSASVLASGAPGAVINYVSDAGTAGLSNQIGLESGLDFNSEKGYFSVGGQGDKGLAFHVDGFLTEGRGARDQGFVAQKGYQVKANVTKSLGDMGWVRVNLKLLNDAEPLYTSYPALVSAGANGFSSLSAYPGFDARKGSTVGVYNQVIQVMDSSTGQLSQKQSDGLHPVANAIGAQLHLTPGNDVTIDDKIRVTQMSGSFSTNFMGLSTASSVVGSTVNGQTVGSIVYANGPKAGQAFTDTYLNTGVQIYTHMGDMGSLANDLNVSKGFELLGGKSHVSAGLFYMDQHIAQDWHPNSHYETLEGSNPAGLNLVSTTGQLLTLNGVSGYNTAWGTGVDRKYDISAIDTAPYLNLNWEAGPLQLDVGVRHDQLRVSGWAESASDATTSVQTINGALVSGSTLDPSTYEALNYGASYNSYSLGALYSLNANTTTFGRISRGGRFNVDRNILSGYTNADGSLNASGRAKAVSMVDQQEIGIKNRGELSGVRYTVNATLFHNSYASSNFDLTQGPTGTYYDSAYKSAGLELEGSLRGNWFGLTGGLTYTRAKITANSQGPTPQDMTSSGVGNQPSGTPSLMYTLAPNFSYGDFRGGLMFVGRGRTNVNSGQTYWAPSEMLVHLNLSYAITQNATISLNVHNLFDKLSAGGHLDQGSLASLQSNGAIGGQSIGTIGAVNGRTTVLDLNYQF